MGSLTFTINTVCVNGGSRKAGKNITISVGDEQWIAACTIAEINLRSRVAPTELDAIRDLLIAMGMNDPNRAVCDDAKIALALALSGSTASQLGRQEIGELGK